MSDADIHRTALAAFMAEHRHALGLTQDEAAILGETISVASWRKLETATPGNYSLRTLGGVDRSLAWISGSAKRVLDLGIAPDLDLVARAQRRVGVLVDPGPPPPSRFRRPPLPVGTTEEQRRALEQLDAWFDDLLEKVSALSWASKNEVMKLIDELLTAEAEDWIARYGPPDEPPPDEPVELREAKEELALAAAGEIEIDADTKAALETVVNEALDASE